MTRLLTFVEVDDTVADPQQISLSARHEAVLSDGGRVLLLADRGWSASGPPDIWTETSVEEITDIARTVVGPDEPFGSRSQKDMGQTTGPRLPWSCGARAWTRTPRRWVGYRTTSYSARGFLSAPALSRTTASEMACLRRLTRMATAHATCGIEHVMSAACWHRYALGRAQVCSRSCAA